MERRTRMSQISWRAIGDLVLATREQPRTERETFVRQECSDPALQDTLSAIIRDAFQLIDRKDALVDVPLEIGARVGPYVVVRRLGRGGMGEVFLAGDTRLDRAVALKCLIPDPNADSDLRGRIAREARAAARINHPHVATVHDVVEHGARTFIVMEYVEGESLAAVLRRRVLPAGRVAEIGGQLASAVAAAHRAGIIHRDLKPANVQLTPDGSVKILDFGIATATVVAASGTTRTDVSVIPRQLAPAAGTPGYMSPEQMLGQPLDERSDIFSLGVVLFEAAAGRKPVDSKDLLDVLSAIVKGLPRLDVVSSGVPENLADVIATCLAFEPERRFRSAVDLQLALEKIAKSSVLESPPRSRWLAIASAVLAVPVMVWVLGALCSAAFDISLGRSGPFAAEGALAYLVWGLNSVVAPLVQVALAIIALWTAGFVLRLVAMWSPAGRRISGLQRRFRDVAERIGLNDPSVFAQALTACGIAAIALVFWRFNTLMAAWTTFISTKTIVNLAPLAPGNTDEMVMYRATLTILLLLMAAGLFRVLRLRHARQIRRARGAVVALSSVVAVILLLVEVPYRLMFKNAEPRVPLDGERCYVIGDNGSEYLVYCPGASPPRNRVVAKTVLTPDVVKSSVVESIFTPAGR
jgi:predicted Ser/Thr protein kinase